MTSRVLVNCCSIVPGQVGGAEQYAVRLLRSVVEHNLATPTGIEVELAALRGFRQAHPVLADLFEVHELGLSGSVRSQRAVLESSWLRYRSRGFDLVHHMGGRLPAVRQDPALVTIHDIQPLDEPQNFSRVKRWYLGAALPRSIRNASAIATPEACTGPAVIDGITEASTT